MNNLDLVLKSMNFDYCGAGKHKITMEKLISSDNAVFLDVRSNIEIQSINLNFKIFKIRVLNIPIDEIPDRIKEIPHNEVIGIFCNGGVRASIVYAYLKSKDFNNVFIVTGGYDTITNPIIPGNLFKQLQKIKENENA